MIVSNVVKRGFSCPRCSDKVSYPEKFILELFNQLNIEFDYQKTFDWSKNIVHTNPKLCGNKRYDFSIPVQNMIIETHGIQHSKERTGYFNNLTLKEEQENDELKKALALKNDIECYVVLDCSLSEMEYIKNSVKKSRLATVFNLDHIDWLKCHEATCHSLVKIACDLWNQGNTTKEIAKIIKLASCTIVEMYRER